MLASEVFLKARSATKVPIHTKYDGTHVYTSNFNIPALKVQLADVEGVVKADKGKCSVYVDRAVACSLTGRVQRLL